MTPVTLAALDMRRYGKVAAWNRPVVATLHVDSHAYLLNLHDLAEAWTTVNWRRFVCVVAFFQDHANRPDARP